MKLVNPKKIHRLIPALDKKLLGRLIYSMKVYGWKGRPVLVENWKDGCYHAWTGIHRIEAALRVDLESIPVAMVERGFLNGQVDIRDLPSDIDKLEWLVKQKDWIAVYYMSREILGID